MQLLHQTISKLKGFKEVVRYAWSHESQLVLGLKRFCGNTSPSHARLRNWSQAISDVNANALQANANSTKSYQSGKGR